MAARVGPKCQNARAAQLAALIRQVRKFGAERPSIEMFWDGFRELGIWSKPAGAAFLCIEPWHGFASPSDFDGDFKDKPGLMHIAPAESRTLKYRVRIGQNA
jgi:galactose mutarotase-like enzyme